METAKAWGVPPGVILRPGHPGTWTTADRILATAWIIAEKARCGDCGHPKAESWNPDSEGWYESREATCQGCAEIQRRTDGEREHHPERKRWVVDTRPADVELKPWRPSR